MVPASPARQCVTATRREEGNQTMGCTRRRRPLRAWTMRPRAAPCSPDLRVRPLVACPARDPGTNFFFMSRHVILVAWSPLDHGQGERGPFPTDMPETPGLERGLAPPLFPFPPCVHVGWAFLHRRGAALRIDGKLWPYLRGFSRVSLVLRNVVTANLAPSRAPWKGVAQRRSLRVALRGSQSATP